MTAPNSEARKKHDHSLSDHDLALEIVDAALVDRHRGHSMTLTMDGLLTEWGRRHPEVGE